MMEPVTFFIPGKPQPKLRPKAQLRYRNGRPYIHIYTPAPTTKWEKRAAELMSLDWGERPPLAQCLVARVVGVWKRPKSRPAAVSKEAWATGERCWRPGTQDADNVVKSALDALEKAGVVENDRWVVLETGSTVYAAEGEGESVEIELRPAPWRPRPSMRVDR